MANNETTTKFKVDISELKKAMQDAKRAVAVANSEFKATAATMDDWTKSTAGISAKLKNLDSNLKNQKTILASLEAQYEALTDEQKKGSKEADNLRIKINNQQAVVNRTEKEISEYEQSLEEVAKAEIKAAKEGKTVAEVLEETGNEAEGAEGGFTILKGAVAGFISGALTALASGLGEAISALGSFGDAAEKAMNGFQAATDASSAEMAEFDDVMKNIYNNNYGENFEDIANSMATVKQMAGDIGADELEKLTTNALTLRDTFGMEVNESMRAAQSLMDQFGISGDEAFNLIAQGAQNGLNQNDDLLDTVNEYSVQFKDAGYGAEEMFNMLANGAESGTWSIDKLGDAVKEYNIRMTDGTANEYLEELGLNADELTAKYAKGGESAQEVNDQVISALMGVEDEQQRYIIGQGIMGTMWEDLGEDAIKSLMSTEGEISNTKNALEEIGNVKYNSVGEAMQGIGRNLQTGILLPISEKILPKIQELADKFSAWLADPATQSAIDNLATNIGEVLAGAIDIAANAFKWIIDNKDVLIGAFAGIAGGFAAFKAVSIVTTVIGTITKLIGIVKAAGGVFAALKLALAAIGGPVTIIITVIGALVAAFVTLWNTSDEFRNFWINLWEKIKEAIGVAKDWISQKIDEIGAFFTETLPEFFSGCIDWIKKNWQSILAFLINPFAGLFTYFYQNNSKFKEFVDNAVNFIKELPGKIWTWLLNTINKVTEWRNQMNAKAKEAALNFINNVVNFIKELPGKIWTWLQNVISKVVAWGTDLANKGKAAAKMLFDAVVNKVKEIPGQMLSIGSNIVSGIWSGISNGISWLKNNIESLADDVSGWLSDAFGINSPSKLMRDEIGRWIPPGIAEGIEQNAKVALEAAKGLAVSTIKETKNGLSTASSNLSGMSTGAVGGTVNNFYQTINSPKQLSRIEIYRQSKNLLSYSKG